MYSLRKIRSPHKRIKKKQQTRERLYSVVQPLVLVILVQKLLTHVPLSNTNEAHQVMKQDEGQEEEGQEEDQEEENQRKEGQEEGLEENQEEEDQEEEGQEEDQEEGQEEEDQEEDEVEE